SKGGAGTPGKLTRVMTTVIPTTAGSRFHADRGPAGAPHNWLSKKCTYVQKMQVKPSFSFKPYLSNRRPMGEGCLQSSASKGGRGSYEKVCPMSRKTRIRRPLP